MGKNQEKPDPTGIRSRFLDPGKAQSFWLTLGAVMTAVALAVKVHALIVSPAVFEFVFFNGPSYTLFIAGLVLVVLALVHDELFRERPETEDRERG